MKEQVNHPAHYNRGGIECIDAIESALTPDEFMGFLKGQELKYVWRAGLKGDATEDFKKADWYNNRARQFIAKMQAPMCIAEEVFNTAPTPVVWEVRYVWGKDVFPGTYSGPGWYVTRDGHLWYGPMLNYNLAEAKWIECLDLPPHLSTSLDTNPQP